jgi:hypothetical protein
MLHWRAVFECEPARKLTVSDGEPAADPMVRKRASAPPSKAGASRGSELPRRA